MDGEHSNTSTPPSGRPTEAECWAAFWEHVAILWLELPPEIQREYAEKYPKGSKKRPMPAFPQES